jgi:hypothetical protein
MKSKLRRLAEFSLNLTFQKKITLALVVANLCVLSLYVSGWSSGKSRTPGAQRNERVVVKKDVIKNEPVEIADIRTQSKTVRVGEAFEAGEEWLKNIDFKLTNRWDKAITYVVLNVDFPETKETGSMMMYSLYLGQQPDVKSTLTNTPLRLEPAESINVSLAAEYERIKKFIESRQSPVGNIHEISVWLDQVMFEDGTVYAAGSIFKRNPDPHSPQKWVPVANKQTAPPN